MKIYKEKNPYLIKFLCRARATTEWLDENTNYDITFDVRFKIKQLWESLDFDIGLHYHHQSAKQRTAFGPALHRFYTKDGNSLSDVAQHLADATSHTVG